MSSSIRSNKRSSKEEYEETDEMLMESLPNNEKKENEYTLSDSEEAEDTDERANRYQYDGFVVPDDFEEGTEGMNGTDTESNRRRKKRRAKAKDYSLDKEDTDLLEENLGTSTDRYKRLKKARKTDTEDDDILDDEEASLSSSYHRERKYQTLDDMKIINQIFHHDTEGDDQDRVCTYLTQMIVEDENELMDDRRKDLKGYFNPEEIEERFQTERDKMIVEKDEPERFQLRFRNRHMPDNPELIEETNWLVERIMIKNNITSKDTSNLKKRVHKVLEYIVLAGCEVRRVLNSGHVHLDPQEARGDVREEERLR